MQGKCGQWDISSDGYFSYCMCPFEYLYGGSSLIFALFWWDKWSKFITYIDEGWFFKVPHYLCDMWYLSLCCLFGSHFICEPPENTLPLTTNLLYLISSSNSVLNVSYLLETCERKPHKDTLWHWRQSLTIWSLWRDFSSLESFLGCFFRATDFP